jgi:hypothetical protein
MAKMFVTVHQFQIGTDVVGLVAVNVVNVLIGPEYAPKFALDNQAMFTDISFRVRPRMVRAQHANVSLRINKPFFLRQSPFLPATSMADDVASREAFVSSGTWDALRADGRASSAAAKTKTVSGIVGRWAGDGPSQTEPFYTKGAVS